MKRTVDIARTGRCVISRTDTALPAVRRGLRLTFAKHISVSKPQVFRHTASERNKLLLYHSLSAHVFTMTARLVHPIGVVSRPFMGLCVPLF